MSIACVQLANCVPGYPTECAKVLCRYGVNQEYPTVNTIAVERTSRGAVKGLYE